MKKIFLPFLVMIAVTSCHNAEIDTLKKENALLSQQIADLQQGKTPTKTKYILKLHLKQSHFSLSITKHLKDYANSIDFEIPVDKEYFDSVEKGTKIVDKFRFGSLVLYGSFGDWEMTVKEKVVR
jgi:Tfp pilus assembly protein PilN